MLVCAPACVLASVPGSSTFRPVVMGSLVEPDGGSWRDHVSARLSRHERLEVPLEGRRHAAVAVVMVDDPGGASLLITRRATAMRAHAGQWALPGGRIDEGEDPVAAARRELSEEVGVVLGVDSVLGLLDDYPTRSGYVITPVVLWGGSGLTVTTNPDEVHSVHHVSLTELQRPDSPRFIRIPESERPVVQVLLGESVVHAPTAAVLLQFRRVALEGVCERVHEYEQPVFAWR